MSKYKIVFSDLDGTLLRLDMRVSEENRLAIKKMTELGTSFVVSSGRVLSGFPRDVVENPDIRYLICSNGTVIYDKKSGKNIYTKYLERDDIDTALSVLSDYDNLILIHYDGKSYADKKMHVHETYLDYNVNSYYETFINETNVKLDDFGYFKNSIPHLEMFTVFFKTQDAYDECMERLHKTGKFKLASSAPYNMEIFSIDAGKGAAVGVTAKLLGVDPSHTIAVGDSTNDLTMIEAAGLGLAMQNAFDEVKAKADATICHFNENCADYILKNYII